MRRVKFEPQFEIKCIGRGERSDERLSWNLLTCIRINGGGLHIAIGELWSLDLDMTPVIWVERRG